MHLVVAFLIGTAFLGGFFDVKESSDKSINISPEVGEVRIHNEVDPLNEFTFSDTIKQKYDYSCGSAALGTLLNKYLGESLDEKQVISGMLKYGDKELIIKRRAFSFLDMKRFVDALGYKGAGYKAKMSDLKNLDSPGIVPIKLFGYRHFTVLKGIHDGHVFLADPWKGNISFTIKDFLDAWYENVIFIAHSQGKKTYDLLALKESDLRYITEDVARKEMFDPQDIQKGLIIDRYHENLAGPDVLYKK